MVEHSKIEWTDHTFNPWRGCTKVSEGCANCYAETMSGRNPSVLGVWGKNGTREIASESMWKQPLKWNRDAERDGVRRKVFCASLADVFESDETMPDNAIADVRRAQIRLFETIRITPSLSWLLLSKRPENVFPQIRVAIDTLYKAMSRYNETYDTSSERANSDTGGSNGRIGNRLGRSRLAAEKKNGQPLDGRDQDDSMHTSPSRDEQRVGLSSGESDEGRQTGIRSSSSSNMAFASRADTSRYDHQPSRRQQEQQSSVESGIGNLQSATNSCSPETERGARGRSRGESSENDVDGRDGVGYSTAEEKWRDGQVSGRPVQYEIKGDFSDLLPSHLETSALKPLHGWLTDWLNGTPPDNVWIGTTVENQEQADKRIPELLRIDAKVHFLSVEPMLGPIDLMQFFNLDLPCFCGNISCDHGCPDWVICGGESGPEARPMHPDWARSLRDQCNAANVPFFFKQWGEWVGVSSEWTVWNLRMMENGKVTNLGLKRDRVEWPDNSYSEKIGKKKAGRLLDGREWNQMPEVTNA